MNSLTLQFDAALSSAVPAAPNLRALAAFQRIEIEVKDTFGDSISFWNKMDGAWFEVDENLEPFGAPIDWEAIGEVQRSKEPGLLENPNGSWLILLPVQVEYQTLVAVGAVETEEPKMLEQLLRAWVGWKMAVVHRDELFEENSGFVRQVTEDLEELTFLRQLTQHLEMTSIGDGISSLAKNILCLLNCAIRAEQVLMSTTELGGSCVTQVGKPIVSPTTIESFIEKYEQRANSGPVVMNGRAEEMDDLGVDVKSLIICPIAKSGQNLGWLVAINRVNKSSQDQHQKIWNRINSEFGSSEATLLGGAAGILAGQLMNAELFHEKEKLLTSVVRSLVSAIEAKDKYTKGHSERVALFGKKLAEALGFDQSEQERVYLSGLLHDVGKIGISDRTLGKTSRLTEEEFAEIKRHPMEGWQILQELDQLSSIMSGVLYHHERVDGKGYPEGLIGDEIPIDGRILSIADAFDAMTSDRPYRNGMPIPKAMEILKSGSGTQWDTDMVNTFLGVIDEIEVIMDGYQL